MNDLAESLVAHERWRWMEGMLLVFGGITVRIPLAGSGPEGDLGFCPVLTDPATQGCLLELIDEQCAAVRVEKPYGGGDGVWHVRVEVLRRGAFSEWTVISETRGEALAKALLGVWG